MTYELEALLAHIYIVGGRAVASAPPGAQVVLSPKRAVRTRQDETFFTLLVPNGTIKAQAAVYESLAQQAADIYFHSSGGITGALRETLIKLNQHLLDEQQKLLQPLRVSLLCAVMRENEVYVARSGTVVAIFRDGKNVTTFPRVRSDETLSIAPPLGATMEPRVELSHFELKPNAMLILADGLNKVSDEALNGALADHDTISDVLEPLRALVETPLAHITVIQFVTEDTPTPQSPNVPDASPSKPTPSAPSLESEPQPQPQLELQPKPEPEASKPSPTPAPLTPPPVTQTTLTPPPITPTPVEKSTVSETSATDPKTEDLPEAVTTQEETTNPEAPVIEDEPNEKRSIGMRQVFGKTISNVAATTSKVGNKIFPEPKEAVEAVSDETTEFESADTRVPWVSNLVVLVALIIPLVIIVVVVGLALRPPDDSNFEICRVEVIARRDAATGLTPQQGDLVNNEKLAQAREQWFLVREEALECEREKPGDREMREIAGEAQNNLDRFERVTRRDVLALRRFKPDAELHGPVSGNWITIYTLDRFNDEVYQDVLSTDGKTLVEVSDDPLIFRGQNIGGFVIDEIIDVEWIERGGLPAGNTNVPIALDENGLLIWYNETFGENQVLPLITPATWSRPTAMAIWRLNLYILDTAGQQVWRYVPTDGLYSELPEEYFSGEERPDLTTAVDIGIDEDGSVYVLFQNGDIKKFRGGVEQPFDIYNLPEGAMLSANSLFVDNNAISRGIAVTDPEKDTLYTMSLGGTVNVGYRPLNLLDAFDNISGALVNPDTNSIYVLSNNFLYRMSRQ